MKPVRQWSFGAGAAVLMGLWCVGAVAHAQGQTNPSRSFGPESCGRADPAYIRTANETGGVPMFLQRSEVGKAFQLVRESTRQNVSTVLWASAALDGRTRVFDVPVDSVTQRITVTFSVDTKGGRLVLRESSGRVVSGNAANVEDTELNCGRIVTATAPEPGMWRAEITGAGRFWLEAEAQSDIYIVSAEFVKLGGRIGHEGLFPIQGQPLARTPATLRASLSAADTETTEFAFVSQSGDTIKSLHMTADNNDRKFLEFTGRVELPDGPFRLAVKGRDVKGRPYQRFYGPLFHAETVEVIPQLKSDEMAAGSNFEAVFAVRNLGASRTFKVTVTDARRLVTNVEPTELVLGAHETHMVRIGLKVPEPTAAGTGDDLVVVVESTSGQATSNSSVVHLTVTGKNGKRGVD